MRVLQAERGTALTTPEEAGLPARRRLGILLCIAAFVYAVDVVSKVVVVATLPPGHDVRLLGGWLTLIQTRNSGAAFSIGTSMTVLFALIAVGVIAFILHTARRLYSLPWAVSLGLLLGGATGNLTDRLLRTPGVFRGDVVDWIQVPHFPVFNAADSAIVCGGVLAVLLASRGIHLDGTRDGVDQPGEQPGERAAENADGSGREAGGSGVAGGGEGGEQGGERDGGERNGSGDRESKVTEVGPVVGRRQGPDAAV